MCFSLLTLYSVLFLMKTKDKYKDVIEMDSIDSSSFELVLQYIYTEIMVVTSENVLELLRLVDFLGMDREFTF